MTVLVLGGSGLIGASLSQVLVARGVATMKASRNASHSADVRLDIADDVAVGDLLRDGAFTTVVNAAACGVVAGTGSRRDMYRTNVAGAAIIAKAVLNSPAPTRLIHLSSAAEPRSGQAPESHYAHTKALGTSRVRDIFMAAGSSLLSIVRIHNAYSDAEEPGRFVSEIISAARARRPFRLNFPHRIRDFCYAGEVAARIADLCVASSPNSPYFEIGTGQGHNLRDAAKVAYKLHGAPLHLIESISREESADPHPVEFAGLDGGPVLLCETSLEDGLRRVIGEAV